MCATIAKRATGLAEGELGRAYAVRHLLARLGTRDVRLFLQRTDEGDQVVEVRIA
jgi:hypothetical protein